MIKLSLHSRSLELDLERKLLVLRDGDQRIDLPRTEVAQMMTFLLAHPTFFEDCSVEASVRPITIVPRFADLLETGTLKPGMSELMLGIQAVSCEPLLISWQDFRSGGVGGRGRSGKTNTLFFLSVQAILSGAEVWVADPHYNKVSSLTALLRPLAQHVRLAGTLDETAQMIEDVSSEISRRKAKPGPSHPLVVIFDEWNGILEDFDGEEERRTNGESYSKRVAATLLQVEREMGGYEMYSLLGVSDWSDKAIGGASLRRLIHSVLCHRMTVDYSKYILESKQWCRQTAGLHTGHLIYKDNEGSYTQLIVPFISAEDAATIARLLAEHRE